MSYNSKYTGAQVEALLDKVGNTYTKTEADAATTAKINVLDVASKGGAGKYIQAISQTDGKISATEASMPTALKNPSAITIQKNGVSVGSYDGSEAKTVNISDVASAATLSSHTGNATVHITAAERTKWNKVVTDLAAILGTDSDTIINKWEEVVAFLDTYTEADTLANLLSNKVSKSGDTMTGRLLITTNTKTLKLGSRNNEWSHYETDAPRGHWFNTNVSVQGEIYAGTNYNQKVWHAGNDGSGSGLDADLLDGYHLGSTINTIPYYRSLPSYTEFGSVTDDETYFRNILKWTRNKFGTKTFLCGEANPNSAGSTFIHIYNTDNTNNEGYPQYSSGLYIGLSNVIRYFTTNNYSFSTRIVAFRDDNVASATKLETARTLTIGSTGKTFNGTADVSWSLAEIGAAAASHAHTFVSLTGKPTTLSGYGITDAKIANGVITLGGNTITPLTSHQSLANYYTKTETNNQISAAIAAAITQTLNTAV